MEFGFSDWMLILKKHAIKESPSNEDLIRDFLFYIREMAMINTKTGEQEWFAKESVSVLLNKKEDLPKRVRSALLHFDVSKVCAAIDDLFNDYWTPEELKMAAIDEVEVFCRKSRDEKAKNRAKELLSHPKTLLTYLLIQSAKVTNKIYGIRHTIFERGNSSLNYMFGDIIKMSLSSKHASKRGIFVIPVDVDFHFHVTKSGELPACVSLNTIHGKWIARLKNIGITEDQITQELATGRDRTIGSIETFEANGSLFYLLACSKFDENNVAHSTKSDIQTALQKLLKYHDSFGQGDPLYIPLIGTGRSRAKLDLAESFELLKTTITQNQQWHNGAINIVIYATSIKEAEKLENVLQN